MSKLEKRTISLPDDHAAFVDAMVASGGYASTSEVVHAGLRALKERDEALRSLLLKEVAPVYDAMMLDPARGIDADDVFVDLRKLQASRRTGA